MESLEIRMELSETKTLFREISIRFREIEMELEETIISLGVI